jgi:general secretion pathway protein B
MSYILDALRKADAQRERDSSRGIHANPASLGPSGDGASAKSRGMWTAAAVGIAIALGAGAFFMRGSAPSAPTALNTPAAAPKGVAPADLPPAMPVKMQPPQAVANAIVPAAPPPVAPAQRAAPPMNLAPGVAVPGLSADERSRQAREAAFSDPSRMPMGRSALQTAPAPQLAQAIPQPPGAASPAPAAAGLPPDAPKVSISGGVYSSSPAQRMLIVNGQVFNEGSEVAPGLVIEKIEPRTATLTFRGARYVVAY